MREQIRNSKEYPLISIVVPVYNVEKYLDKCVQSLINQTYQNIEIVLVDDGSPDRCPALCDAWAEKCTRVTTFHKENGGLGSARNYGTRRACGDWIIYLDSDDYVDPDYVKNMWWKQRKTDADMVVCGVMTEKEDGTLLDVFEQSSAIAYDEETAFFRMYLQDRACFYAVSKMIRKEILLKEPFPDGYYEDFATAYRWISHCSTIVFGKGAAYYHYVKRDGSILKTDFSDKHLYSYEVCRQVADYWRKKNSTMVNYEYLLYQRETIQILNWQYLTDRSFDYVYNLYKKKIREGFFKNIFNRKIGLKTKVYSIMLITSPRIYRFVYKISKGNAV